MRIISAALRVLFFTSLPALCAYLGRSDILEIWQEGDYIGEAVDIALLKNVFLFTGVIITGVYLSLSKEIVKHKLYHISIQRTELLNNIKESFLLALENLIEDSQVNSLNVRIWKEKNNLWIRLNNWLKKRMGKTVEKKYGVHLLSGLSSADHMRDLVLRVDPDPQGLVGKCYEVKSIVFDEDIVASEFDYQMDQNQLHKTSRMRFCLACPIFNDRSEVTAIVSFDSIYPIAIPEEKEEQLAMLVTVFCQSLYESCPDLFQ